MESTGDRVIRRLTALEGLRAPHEAIWRESFEYSFPERADYIYAAEQGSTAADRKRAELTDSTGIDAAKTLAAGLVGGIVPANSQWFDLDTGRLDDDQTNNWLSEIARSLWQAIHASNFDSVVIDCMIDAVCAGWFVLFVDEAEAGGYQFEWWPVGECWVAASKPSGPVDTVYRAYSHTVEQCVTEYGIDAVSETVRRKYESGRLDELVQLVRAIEPRKGGRRDSPMPQDLPIASYTVERQGKHLVRESGYHEFPCAVPRWRMIPRSAYAKGPYSDVLPDVKTLNALTRAEIQSAELEVAGMWKARDDGVLNPSAVRIGPRRIVAVADMDNLQRLDTRTGSQRSFSLKADLQAAIRHALKADQLQPQDKPQMTAYEVSVRVQMIRQLLGPDFGRFQPEFLAPIIHRCIGLADRAGVLPAPPSDVDFYAIQYRNPLSRSQRMEESESTKAFIAQVAATADSKQDPSVWDLIDLDKAHRHVADGEGVPSDVLRDPDDVADLRAKRQQAQEQAAQQEQQAAMQAATVKRVAA